MQKLFFSFMLLVTMSCHAQLIQGYNNPWFFGNFYQTAYYPPTSVINKIKALNPGVLRFPGGKVANSYDVYKPGYGQPGEKANLNYVVQQARLARDVGAQTIYVANIYSALVDTERETYWINNIVTAISYCNPKYVELGNEIPIYPEITGVYSGEPNIFMSKAVMVSTVTLNAQRYIAVCNKVMQAVRAAGFNPEFGVTMDQPFHTRGRTWNTVLRNWAGYDAEIFHIYLTTETYTATRDAITKNLLGSNKPVWITEWAWSHGNGVTTSILNADDIGKPYYIAFPNNFITACSNDSRVEITCRHMLYGTSVYSVIQPEVTP